MNTTSTLSGTQSISAFLNILRRRKLSFLLPCIIVPPAIIAAGLFLPKLYRAQTTILVEPQKVPSHYVQSIVTVPIEERLSTLTQQVMSRSRLLKVIQELNLISEDASPIALENLLNDMQEQIDVEVKGTSFFQIAYTGKDPRNVMLVANKVASLFIEENLRTSERQAQTTTRFISEELEKVQKQLEEQEQKLQAFKQEHVGELPDQEEANLRALDRLQLRLQDTGQALRETEEREMILQKQLLTEKPFEEFDEARQNPILANLLRLQDERDLLKTRYSDEWPRVKQVKEEIAALEAKLEEGDTGSEELALKTKVENPMYKTLEQNVALTKRKIYRLKKAQKNTLKEIEFYRARVEKIPEREQQLISLTRDYEMTKSKYEALLGKKLEANLSESLESKQKGETFKILDAAEIPLMPYEPDLVKVIVLAMIAGISLGAGTVWLKENIDTSLNQVDDAEQNFNVPVIGLIPNLITPADIRRKRWQRFALCIALCLYLGSVFGVIQNKPFVKKYFSVVKSRLGFSAAAGKD